MTEEFESKYSKVNRRSDKSKHFDDRPASFELEMDFTNTETKLVVLDFLSSQPIEQLTARNAKRKASGHLNESRKSLGKSSSDGSSHEAYLSRYAKLAKSGKSLRKQYSLRLKRDLDDYLKLRGKSLDDLSTSWGNTSGSQDESSQGVYLHQRSYTEGEAYMRCRPVKSQLPTNKPRRKISRELREGIEEFDVQNLKHVEVPEVNRLPSYENDTVSKRHRPANLDLPVHQERRISPVLSPESQVAARLELISQEILTQYPDIFEEQISRVSLQDLTYEKFASVARKVLEKYPGGWTRIALVCYFARELALDDELSDEQLDNLVSFSSRFISETSSEWIASQGGWGALEDDSDENLNPSMVRQKLKEQPDMIDGLMHGQAGARWVDYFKYGIAALAVGMTVVYNVAK